MPELQITTESNHFKFVNLKRGYCHPYELNTLLHSTAYKIEGMLFYRKDILYTAGENQFVNWALRWMSIGLFGLPGPQPPGNTTPELYIQKWNENKEEKSKKKKNPSGLK